MHKNFKLTLAAATVFATTVAFMSTSLLAHTRLEVPEVTEGVRTSNNLVIGAWLRREQCDWHERRIS